MAVTEEIEVLLVEDNASDQELALRALRKRNLANLIQVVTDGAEALDFLFARGAYANRNPRHVPKVVLLDIKLPKVSGIEVLRAVKGDPVLKSVPVVMLTSSREEPDIATCYALGANSYIVKPVDFDQFSEAVARLGIYWLFTNESPTLT